jgi:hypothetical protein
MRKFLLHSGPWALLAASLGLAGCQAETATLMPLQWTKVAGPAPHGALLGPGATNSFDERANFTTFAFRDGPKVKLYYGGSDATGAATGISCGHWRIGMADSDDGIIFTRRPGTESGGALLDNGAPGQFDSQLTYRPVVLKDILGDGQPGYRIWFNGSTDAFNCPPAPLALNRRIGYAESHDGLDWAKDYGGDGPGGSVLPLGGAGAIDEQQVGYVAVIKDGAEYKMFYSANDASNTWRVGLATSSDARHWTKVPGKLAGGAILDTGPAGAFDFACAYQPTVVKERDQLYRMWYRGCVARNPANNGPSKGTIGYAESNDGITWIKLPQPTDDGSALGLSPAPAFDSGGLTTPSVFLDATGWNMYYAGFDTGGQYSAGLARAAP